MDFIINIDNNDLDLAKRIANEYEENYKSSKVFVNSLGVSGLIKYFADCNLNIDTNTSLYQCKKVYELSDIADINYKGFIIDVRTFVNSDALYIPKKHVEQDLSPKYYIYAKFDEDNQQVVFKGYINVENINKTQSNDDYYVVYETDLFSMDNLIEELSNLAACEEEFNLEELEGTFTAFCDDELDVTTQLRIIKMLYLSATSAKSFLNFVKFDLLAQKISDFESQLQNEELNDLVTQEVVQNDIENNIDNSKENEVLPSSIVVPTLPVVAPIIAPEVDLPDVPLGNTDQLTMQNENDVNDSTSFAEMNELPEENCLQDENIQEGNFSDESMSLEVNSTNDEVLGNDLVDNNLENFDSSDNFEENNSLEELDEVEEDNQSLDLGYSDDSEQTDGTDNEVLVTDGEEDELLQEDENISFEMGEENESENLEDNKTDFLDDSSMEVLDEDSIESELDEFQVETNAENQEIEREEEFFADAPTEVFEENLDSDLDELQVETNSENQEIEREEEFFADAPTEVFEENLESDLDELQAETNGENQEIEREEEFFADAPTEVFEENLESDLDELQAETNSENQELEDDEEFFVDAPTEVFEENLDSDLDELQNNDELFDIVEETPEIVENTTDIEIQEEQSAPESSSEYNVDDINDLLNELEQSDEDNKNNDFVANTSENTAQEELQTLFDTPRQEEPQEGEKLSDTEYSMYVDQPKQNKSSKLIVPLLSVCVLGGLLSAGAYYKFAHKIETPSDIQSKNIDDFDDTTFLEKAEMDAMNTNELPSDNVAASPDSLKPKDINQSISDVFDDTIYPVMISKIAWEVPENYTTSKYFKKYLQVTGVQLQRELQQNLSKVSELSTTGKVKLSFQIYADNSVKNLKITETSGSGEIDSITLKSVKNTLSYVKVPVIPSSDNFVTLSMVINF